MIRNRSVPPATVIPELAYHDVAQAAAWLCAAFGFRERLRIGEHRAQLVFGDGAMVVTRLAPGTAAPAASATHSMLVRVEDVDAHHDRAARAGGRVTVPPTDHPFGERQYTVEDPGGHIWTFSETIADVDPASWGGTAIALD